MLSMALAALFWIALHALIAGPLRASLVARLGERGFRGLFSLLSLGGLIWLIRAYRFADFMPLWGPLPGAEVIAIVLMVPAFVLLVFSIAPASPTLVGGDSIALWAAAHLYANGDLASVLLFGAILVTAVNGTLSIDRKRHRAMGARWDAFEAQTSRIPFAAILAGRNELRLGELSLWRLALGVILFLVALFLHGTVLGVSPIGG